MDVKTCFKCEKSFRNVIDLIYHIETSHLDFDGFKREFEGKPKPKFVHMSYVCRFFSEEQKEAYLQEKKELQEIDVDISEKQSSQNPSIEELLPEGFSPSESLLQQEILSEQKSALASELLSSSDLASSLEPVSSPKSASPSESPSFIQPYIKLESSLPSIPSSKSASPAKSLLLSKLCESTQTSKKVSPLKAQLQTSFKDIRASRLHIKTEPVTCSETDDDTSSYDENNPVDLNVSTGSSVRIDNQEGKIYKFVDKTYFCLFPSCEKTYTSQNGLKHHFKNTHNMEVGFRKNILQIKNTVLQEKHPCKKEMVTCKTMFPEKRLSTHRNISRKKNSLSYNKIFHKNEKEKIDRCTYECVCGQTYKYMKRMRTHCRLQHNTNDMSCVKIKKKPERHKNIVSNKMERSGAALDYTARVDIVDHPYNYTFDSSLLESGTEDSCSLDFEEIQQHVADINTDKESQSPSCISQVQE